MVVFEDTLVGLQGGLSKSSCLAMMLSRLNKRLSVKLLWQDLEAGSATGIIDGVSQTS